MTMVVDFAAALRKQLREDMNNYADDVSGGGCKDYAMYQHLCGRIAGLALAERHLIDLMERVQRSEDGA